MEEEERYLCFTTLHYTALHYTALQYTALQRPVTVLEGERDHGRNSEDEECEDGVDLLRSRG